ncbi:NLPA lipoprotein [Nostoc edaphicum CCNP1411]|uniref:NLPA lipoprotein n=1 Tax=Nostoc edaphicum CCNP1411 TaxID=1472755 RepID=A0A7D7QS93_9NOSO|nr:MetQ/NlpA family ABC transporter substrate-binding protein [Nostoc edaphicum]QMS92380.1 NLPA lipoprotein [Nostoc edaphicum CCNP1411]
MFSPKFNRRYFILTTGSAIASILFTSCTPKQNSSTGQLVSQSTKTEILKVGSRNSVTEDILKFVQKELAPSQGLEFQIVTISDSIKINDALKNREIDANLFQHELFMKQAAKRLNADFSMLNRSYTSVFALYSKRLKIKSVDEIPVGATIGISNDDSNQDRALKFLKNLGLINLKEKSGEYFTLQDLISHPKNLQIKELDNYALARALDDIDFAVAYSSFLLQAKINLAPIALDDIGIADKKYATGLAILPEKANDPNIQKLNKLLVDPKLKDFINTNYKGTVVPSF